MGWARERAEAESLDPFRISSSFGSCSGPGFTTSVAVGDAGNHETLHVLVTSFLVLALHIRAQPSRCCVYAAQQLSVFTSLPKAWAASFKPSAMVR